MSWSYGAAGKRGRSRSLINTSLQVSVGKSFSVFSVPRWCIFFLANLNTEITEITESTRTDSIFPTDLSEVFMRLIVSTITRASGLATQLLGHHQDITEINKL